MKKLLVLLLVFLLVQPGAYAQRTDTMLVTTHGKAAYDSYMKKRQTYKTAGFIAAGAGLLMGAVSLQWWVSRGFNGTWDLEPLFIAGIVTTGASIPLFIVAGHYKRKARLALAAESSFLPGRLAPVRYPALALQVKL